MRRVASESNMRAASGDGKLTVPANVRPIGVPRFADDFQELLFCRFVHAGMKRPLAHGNSSE